MKPLRNPRCLAAAAALLSGACLLFSACCPARAEGQEAEPVRRTRRYGLHAEEDGTLTLAGKPFRAFGLNYFGAFCHNEDTDRSEPFETGFAGVAAHGIPVVRFPLGGFYPDYYDRFDADPDAMLDRMQRVLDAAAERRVGVIATLFWWDMALCEHVGERRADMGRPDSETIAYAKRYAAAVVGRFADHPAVWGWEIGNEYNLGADLCDESGGFGFLPANLAGLPGFPPDRQLSARDYVTTRELSVFLSEVAGEIRRIDDYRLITTGHAELRPAAWHLSRAARRPTRAHRWRIDWTQDTREQFADAVRDSTPDPIDTVSLHMQSGTANAAEPAYVFTHDRFGGTVTTAEYLRIYAETARAQGKALLFGEFGDMLDMEGAPDCPERFRELCGLVSEAGIDLALLWQAQDYTEEGSAGRKMDVMGELNARLAAEGLQDTDAAWRAEEGTDPPTASPTEAPTEPPTAARAPALSGTEAPSDAGARPAEGGCASAAPLPLALTAAAALAARARGRRRGRGEDR